MAVNLDPVAWTLDFVYTPSDVLNNGVYVIEVLATNTLTWTIDTHTFTVYHEIVTLTYCIEGEFKSGLSVQVGKSLYLKMKPSMECDTFLLEFKIGLAEVKDFMFYYFDTFEVSPFSSSHVGNYTISGFAYDEDLIQYELGTFLVEVYDVEDDEIGIIDEGSGLFIKGVKEVDFWIQEISDLGVVNVQFSEDMQIYKNFTSLGSNGTMALEFVVNSDYLKKEEKAIDKWYVIDFQVNHILVQLEFKQPTYISLF